MARATQIRHRLATAAARVGILDAGRQQRFKEAIVWVKAGRLDRSCPTFEELTEIERKSPYAFYNFGFCVQATGDWRRAHQLYQQADRLTTVPDRDIENALRETSPSATQQKL